jgi:hypothetical protein
MKAIIVSYFFILYYYINVGAGIVTDRGKRFFSSPQHPDKLWSPRSLLSKEYRGQFLGGKATRT